MEHESLSKNCHATNGNEIDSSKRDNQKSELASLPNVDVFSVFHTIVNQESHRSK